MVETCYLAGLKQGGWLTRTGQYSTDITKAAVFALPQALERIRKHREASNVLIPVPVTWMNAI